MRPGARRPGVTRRACQGETRTECRQLSHVGPERAGPLPRSHSRAPPNRTRPHPRVSLLGSMAPGCKSEQPGGCAATQVGSSGSQGTLSHLKAPPLPPQLWPGSSLKPGGLGEGGGSLGWVHPNPPSPQRCPCLAWAPCSPPLLAPRSTERRDEGQMHRLSKPCPPPSFPSGQALHGCRALA